MPATPIFPVRTISDLKDMLEQSCRLFGDRNAFWLKGTDGNYSGITYKQFKNDVDALGTALINLGLKDSFIAVIGENRYEWCMSYLSVVNGTGIVVPLDKELPLNEIQNLLERSNASAIIYSGKTCEEVQSLSGKVPALKYFINMDLPEDNDETLSFAGLLEKGRRLMDAGDQSFLEAEIDSEAMNILLFTSGTTDLAKGVMLSHRNICSDIMDVCKVIYISKDDCVLSMLPLHHTYECTCGFLVIIFNGCRISFIEGLKHIAKNLKEVKPSMIFVVPLILENMYRKIWDQASKTKGLVKKLKFGIFISTIMYNGFGIDKRRKLFNQIHENVGGNLRLIISGAAAIEPTVSKGLRTFGFSVLQGYGLTECSPIVTVNTDKQFKDSSIGLLLPSQQARIDNPNAEGIGELVVKGDNVMLGYFGNKTATEKVLKDGWFRTGDLCKVDKEGFYYITGRQKNVIVTKNGKNIYPEEVEAYLNKSQFILESLVWGKEDEKSDETYVYASIVPDYDAIASKLGKKNYTPEEVNALLDHEVKSVNKNMPLYKRVKSFTIHEGEFTKTSTKKIKRYLDIEGIIGSIKDRIG
ncbi:MAG: AMP-binding protein [Clostridiales bacterium]|nr:AMP-binding protein [Clostridiales bacterium]